MTLPFINAPTNRLDQVIAIDLGARWTKAVHVQKKNDRLALLGYAIQETPNHAKGFGDEAMINHLKNLGRALGERARSVVLAMGVPEAFLRHAELPPMPIADMRQVLRLNSKTYLQQEFPDYVFDCSILFSRQPDHPDQAKPAAVVGGLAKQRVLVGGARRQCLEELKVACRAAGLNLRQVMPGLVGPVNAFEAAEPELFAAQVVALVDIGFRGSTITMLNHGDLVMNRVLTLGGDNWTTGLAETLAIGYEEAEGIKIGMAAEVEETLEPLLLPLGRELRASIDFFEHQQDVTVNQVFLSGGSARSEFVVRVLQRELMVPCRTWNPLKQFQLSLSGEQMAGLESAAPQLTVAVGAAAVLA